jgi:hypothetical protein
MQAVAINMESIRLERKDIKKLFEQGILNKETYTYFALRIEQGKAKTFEVNIEEFAEEWNLKIYDVTKALNSLANKGGLDTNAPAIIQLTLF